MNVVTRHLEKKLSREVLDLIKDNARDYKERIKGIQKILEIEDLKVFLERKNNPFLETLELEGSTPIKILEELAIHSRTDIETIARILALLKPLIPTPEYKRYSVYGLFVDENNQGFVRNITITLEEAEQATGQVRFYGTHSDRCTDVYKAAINRSHQEACRWIGKQLDAWVEIEGISLSDVVEAQRTIPVLDGDSVGLAIALAVVAQSTSQEIGVNQPGDLAVTGALYENATLKRVGGITEKILAIYEWNAGAPLGRIQYVFVPDDNRAEAEQATANLYKVSNLAAVRVSDDHRTGAMPVIDGLEILSFKTLDACYAVLFDPWKEYLDKLLLKAKEFKVTCREQIETFCEDFLEKKRTRAVVTGKFTGDQSDVCYHLAKTLAEKRRFYFQQRRGDSFDKLKAGSYDSPAREIPSIPVVIDAKPGSLQDLITGEIGLILNSKDKEILQSRIIKSLTDNHFILIIKGLDVREANLEFLKDSGAYGQLVGFYNSIPRIIVCTESTWERRIGRTAYGRNIPALTQLIPR